MADAEFVVGGFGLAFDVEGGFLDDLAVLGGVALLVGEVPAQGGEEGVEEFTAELGLVVVAGAVLVAGVGEALDEVENDLRSGHGLGASLLFSCLWSIISRLGCGGR